MQGVRSSSVIFREQVDADAPLRLVADRVLGRLGAGGFDDALSATVADGFQSLTRVGLVGVTKRISVIALPPTVVGERYDIPIRWTATGAAGDLFPTLDGNLVLDPAAPGTTHITLIGSYTPPLGRLGAELDRAVLNRVARRTVRRFLDGIVAVVVADAERGEDRSTAWGERAVEGSGG